MNLKQIFALNFILIFLLLGGIGLFTNYYLRLVDQFITEMVSGNQKEVISLANISLDLSTIFLKLTYNKVNSTRVNTDLDTLHTHLLNWKNGIGTEMAIEDGHTKNIEIGSEDDELRNYQIVEQQYQKLTQLLAALPSDNKLYSAAVNDIRKLILSMMVNIKLNSIDSQAEMRSESHNIKDYIFYLGVILFLSIIFASIMVLGMNWLIQRFIVNNLNKFKRATYKIGIDENYQINLKSGNEFGDLAKSFNDMAHKIFSANLFINNIIETMPNLLFVTDNKFNIVKTNTLARHELGYSEYELQKMNLNNLTHEQITLATENNNPAVSLKIFLIKKNTDSIPVLFASAKMSNVIHQEIFYVHIAQDISQLQKLEKKLINLSRQAGMSDVATSVLHNVGNILNSIKTSISMLIEETSNSLTGNLPKIVELINQNKADLGNFMNDTEKGKAIVPYLLALTEAGDKQKIKMQTEFSNLQKKVDHITDIITTQQTMNKMVGVIEQTDIRGLIDEALILNQTAQDKMNISIYKNFHSIKKPYIDRVKLMQVLVNLIKNAFESLLVSKNKIKALTFNLYDHDQEKFIIEIIDNGRGIDKASIDKIFSYGFTTKKHGHGFGLHSCALAIKEMGGNLEAKSEGVNNGAKFSICLPYKPIKETTYERR